MAIDAEWVKEKKMYYIVYAFLLNNRTGYAEVVYQNPRMWGHSRPNEMIYAQTGKRIC